MSEYWSYSETVNQLYLLHVLRTCFLPADLLPGLEDSPGPAHPESCQLRVRVRRAVDNHGPEPSRVLPGEGRRPSQSVPPEEIHGGHFHVRFRWQDIHCAMHAGGFQI